MKINLITKDMKGKVIYVRGKDNLAKRGGPTPLEKATVVKVNPKSVILDIEGRETKIDHKGKCIPCWNAGYHMYSDEQYAIDEERADKLAFKIRDALTSHNLSNIDPRAIIKAANVLVKQRGDEWDVKVADFGLAKMMDATGASSNTYTTGTLAWSAPETFDGKFGEASDMFSFVVEIILPWKYMH